MRIRPTRPNPESVIWRSLRRPNLQTLRTQTLDSEPAAEIESEPKSRSQIPAMPAERAESGKSASGISKRGSKRRERKEELGDHPDPESGICSRSYGQRWSTLESGSANLARRQPSARSAGRPEPARIGNPFRAGEVKSGGERAGKRGTRRTRGTGSGTRRAERGSQNLWGGRRGSAHSNPRSRSGVWRRSSRREASAEIEPIFGIHHHPPTGGV